MRTILSFVNRQYSIVNVLQSIPVDQIFISDLLKGHQLRLPFVMEPVQRRAARDRAANGRRTAQTVEVRRPPLEVVRVEPGKLIDNSNAGFIRFKIVPVRDDDSDTVT